MFLNADNVRLLKLYQFNDNSLLAAGVIGLCAALLNKLDILSWLYTARQKQEMAGYVNGSTRYFSMLVSVFQSKTQSFLCP